MEIIADKIIFVKTIELSHSKVHLREDGIVQIYFGDDVELDIKESTDIVNAIGVLTEGKKVLVLNIAGKNTTATGAARNHSASEDGLKFTIADAFVSTSLAQKLLGNFYMNFHKPSVPTRLFDNVEAATDWLKSHL